MKTYLKFLLVGLLFSIFPAEIMNQLIIHKAPQALVGVALLYSILISAYYFIAKLTRGTFMTVLYYVLPGILGLFIEWQFLGNSGVIAIGQISMFTFWGSLALLPYIFTDTRLFADKARKEILFFYIPYTFLCAVVPLMFLSSPYSPNLSWFMFGYVSPLLNIFYLRYFLAISRA
jgi:hypothetical protein